MTEDKIKLLSQIVNQGDWGIYDSLKGEGQSACVKLDYLRNRGMITIQKRKGMVREGEKRIYEDIDAYDYIFRKGYGIFNSRQIDDYKIEPTKEGIIYIETLVEPKTSEQNEAIYISEERISELENLRLEKYDLYKLITLCKEVNIAYKYRSYYSVSMLLRAIVDHIGPIFGTSKPEEGFGWVVDHYSGGGKSFKKHMKHLKDGLKNLADGALHSQIRAKESKLNETSIHFIPEVDALLAEVIRLLK